MNKPTLKVVYDNPLVPKRIYGNDHASVIFTYPATGNYKAFFAFDTREPDDEDPWDKPDPTIGIEYKNGLFIAEFICGKHLSHMAGIGEPNTTGKPDVWIYFAPRETRLGIIQCKGVDVECFRINRLTGKEVKMGCMTQTDRSVELTIEYHELATEKGVNEEERLKNTSTFSELSDEEVQSKVDELKAQKEGKLLQWRSEK